MRKVKGQPRWRQRGSIGAVDALILFGILAFVGTVFWPNVVSFQEGRRAATIADTFNVILTAAYRSPHGQSANYSGIGFTDIMAYLPKDFVQRAPNGENFAIDVNSSDNTKVDVSLTIPDQRLRDRVTARFHASQIVISSNTVTISGP